MKPLQQFSNFGGWIAHEHGGLYAETPESLVTLNLDRQSYEKGTSLWERVHATIRSSDLLSYAHISALCVEESERMSEWTESHTELFAFASIYQDVDDENQLWIPSLNCGGKGVGKPFITTSALGRWIPESAPVLRIET